MPIYDITVPIHPGMPIYEGDPAVEIAAWSALRKGDSANVSFLHFGAHTGTHVDAPAHFLDGGTTLEQIPLDRFVGPATVLDLRDRAAIDAAALGEHDIPRDGIVLCKTDNSALWRRSGFQRGFTYVTLDAAEHLLACGVKTLGMDYLSIEQFGSKDFPVHKRLLGRGVLIIEGLDLSTVSAGTYTLVCLPLNLQGVDGAPARAILMR